ncbi:hypothetical protein KAU19_00855 [Candidatus Parcubacteria bacterium]|nr:hypothetical protein [Candidatus Parcubacteria bacterium]
MDITTIFNSIRDIPYKIPLSLDDKAIDCDKKHKKLFDLLTKQGLKVRFRICVFLWSELNIPAKILKIPHIDKCEHLYLEIFIDGQWVALDATWDIGLKNIFQVNKWDGKSNTALAVNPIEIYSPQENKSLSHNKTKESFLEDIKTSGSFYEAVNEWLEENRI